MTTCIEVVEVDSVTTRYKFKTATGVTFWLTWTPGVYELGSAL